jgi:UDP-N-acetylmuramoyl-tripeptide--D-alanyl-D-alanine ligase
MLARACGASVRRQAARRPSPPAGPGPLGVAIDSRTLSPGELFVGLRGERADGGRFAAAALAAGAWGVLVAPGAAPSAEVVPEGAAVLVHPEPLAALALLAAAWRAQLARGGARVVAITGSTGKTSTKDILAALLSPHLRTAATAANLNTEIGLPLTILRAPADTECLVLELAMRGPGQIAELTAIAEPDVGVIVNVGEAHLELLGSVEAIAAAKAELIAGLRSGTCAVVPFAEPMLEPHLRLDVRTVTFGADGADVWLAAREPDGRVRIGLRQRAREVELLPSFTQAHLLTNLLAAVAAADAIGVTPGGRVEVELSASRGQRLSLAGGVTVIDDCYNANPMSMRAALTDLAETAAARRVAVLGEMLELGPEGARLHREIGAHASACGVELLIAVGPLGAEIASAFAGPSHQVADAGQAAELARALVDAGDTVLVKGSRGVGLERVVAALAEPAAAEHPGGGAVSDPSRSEPEHAPSGSAGSGRR